MAPFTELIVDRCTPAEVQAIDPSEGQLSFARSRPGTRMAQFRQGDAMALPFAEDRFDVAIMALVIFFVPEPTKGVAEMVRVIHPGGTVATYAWDMFGGGFPLEPIRLEMNALGLTPPGAPRRDASRMEALRGLWTGAGLEAVETREITVSRTFADFDDFWKTALMHWGIHVTVAEMAPKNVDLLRARVRSRLPTDAEGRITCGARANAIRGCVPG
jgi:SAM-dependent methyltransferase